MYTLLYIGVNHALFITLFLLFTSKRNICDYIIIVWMVFLALPLISQIISPNILNISIPVISNKLPYGLIYGPLLWLYTSELTGGINWNNKLRLALHAFPFIFASCIELFFVSQPIAKINLEIGNTVVGNLFATADIISAITYSIMVLKRLKQHEDKVLHHFSRLSNQVTLKWLKWLTLGFITVNSLPIIGILFYLPELLGSRRFSFFGLIWILSFFGIKQTQIFHSNDRDSFDEKLADSGFNQNKLLLTDDTTHDELKPVEWYGSSSLNEAINAGEHKEKYERSGLTSKRALEYLERLEAYIQAEKPYLDSNLTIEKLAQQVHMPKHYLSQITSVQLDKNFYLFINEYRIDHVKALIQTPGNEHMTLLNMAMDSGFNSKSTFNKVFKKITGVTPSQYRTTHDHK